MAAVHPIEVLDDRLRGLLERYESAVSDAVDPVTGKFSGEIAGLIEQFGAQELEINFKYYPITVLPKNLHLAFGPVSALRWQDLSGHIKTGQRWSGQNRPTDEARD
jgi:hypothetical protein